MPYHNNQTSNGKDKDSEVTTTAFQACSIFCIWSSANRSQWTGNNTLHQVKFSQAV